jgi:small subunit ribosomal protein S6
MAAEKPTYDLMLLLNTAADDGARAKLVADTRKSIESGGELIGYHEWGVRALAYPIDHHTDAEYHLFQLHATAELLASLDRTLHIADDVLRHRIIKLEPGTPPPPQVRPEPRPAAATAPTAAPDAAETQPEPAEPAQPAPEPEPAQPDAEAAPAPAA